MKKIRKSVDPSALLDDSISGLKIRISLDDPRVKEILKDRLSSVGLKIVEEDEKANPVIANGIDSFEKLC